MTPIPTELVQQLEAAHAEVCRVSKQGGLLIGSALRAAIAHLRATFPESPLTPSSERRGIYVASRSRHGHRWRALRDEGGVPIISTWIDESGPGQTTDYADLMRRCIEEASTAAAFICFAEPGDIDGWKGVWFEMGAACAHGVPVFFVGQHDFPSALLHPNVTFCADMRDALNHAEVAGLNNCPACGRPPTMRPGPHAGWFSIGCQNPECPVKPGSTYPTKGEAIRRWNSFDLSIGAD